MRILISGQVANPSLAPRSLTSNSRATSKIVLDRMAGRSRKLKVTHTARAEAGAERARAGSDMVTRRATAAVRDAEKKVPSLLKASPRQVVIAHLSVVILRLLQLLRSRNRSKRNLSRKTRQIDQ